MTHPTLSSHKKINCP